MKPNFGAHSKFENKDLKLNAILSSLNLDNFSYRIITGTTDSVANTQRLFKHGMTPRPWVVLPVEGDIYTYQISNTDVDIRSTQSAVAFKAYALG